MLKPVVLTWTAHAMTAPAAIRMRLTPRPMVQPPSCPVEWHSSPAARDGDEFEIRADLVEQPVQAGHKGRVSPLCGARRRLEAERPDDKGFADQLEFEHRLFRTRPVQARTALRPAAPRTHRTLTRPGSPLSHLRTA